MWQLTIRAVRARANPPSPTIATTPRGVFFKSASQVPTVYYRLPSGLLPFGESNDYLCSKT
jgi:hypothetical protein